MRKIILCLALVGFGLAGQSARVPLALAGGNSDAAHACQHGGFANLAGVTSSGQVFSFTNEGDCVSYAAHGGTFTTPMPTCTVSPGVGCLTFSGVTLPSGTGNSITLTGATSFDDTCTTPVNGTCIQTVLPNTLATGGGDYMETNSSGGVISQGSYQIADTVGTTEGLRGVEFLDSSNNPVACNDPSVNVREVFVVATLIDVNSGVTQAVGILAATFPPTPSLSFGDVFAPSDVFVGSIPSTTITC